MKSVLNVNSEPFSAEKTLHILGCGMYKDVDQELKTIRPNGRNDFHLLFAVHGQIDSFGRTAPERQGFFFYPNERQEYIYGIGEETLYYWIHFIGRDAESLLGKNFPRQFEYTAHFAEVCTILQMMINAMSYRKNYPKGYAEILLRALLALLTSETLPTRFGKVLAMMRDFPKIYTLGDYANACSMSEGHFIRCFKNEVGTSPMAYRSELQIEHAKQLLTQTALPIVTVAEMSGFGDAMYFSRAFKKKTGIAPTEYRRHFS